MKNNSYIVYCAKVGDEIVYIGSGLVGREKHCITGTSHCYDLNRIHFSGVELQVSILKNGLTKDESLKIEKQMILAHRPKCNRTYNPDWIHPKRGRYSGYLPTGKLLEDCKTTEQFEDTCKFLDPLSVGPVNIDYNQLLNMLSNGELTIKEATILSYISENVVCWNYFTGRRKDMEHITPNLKNLGTMLKGLEEKGLIKVLHRGFCHKDSVVIQVNPFYTWKGDIKLRDASITNWYSSKNSKI